MVNSLNRKITAAYMDVRESVDGSFIRPNLPWLYERYSRFNKSMFNNELRPVWLKIPTKCIAAMGETAVMRDMENGSIYSDTIRITDGFLIREDVLEDILLHEMIHVKNITEHPDIIHNEIVRGRDTHGVEIFKNELARINNTFGRNIVINQPIYDSTKYKTVNGDNIFTRERDMTTVFCVHTSDGNVDVYRAYSQDAASAYDKLKRFYGDTKIDAIRPKNIAFIDIPLFDKHGSHITLSKTQFADFEKRMMTEPITLTEDEIEIPEDVKIARRNGVKVELVGNAWEFTLCDY